MSLAKYKKNIMKLNGRRQVLVYANDCYLMGESINTMTKKKANALLFTSTPAGLAEDAEVT
jgi:hypothetical protein